MTPGAPARDADSSAASVLRNGNFLRLWLAQLVTQVGGNMVLYGLTVLIYSATNSNAAVSVLLLTFLVPAVIFSAVAGVYVDRWDRRLVLIVTNLLRAAAFTAIFFVQDQILLVYLLNIFISTVTTFFGPAEAAMIPVIVRRDQLMPANGVFTLTLNAAFALGFALFGPLVVTVAGAPALILLVAGTYLVAAALCVALPASPPPVRAAVDSAVHEAELAVSSTFAQLREGLQYIREHRNIGWSLTYLAITASLIGVLGVLGPDFATESLGLAPKDFVVVVLPLGGGIVVGILLLNAYGRLLPRRRLIESGLITFGVLLGLLSVAGPITRVLQGVHTTPPIIDLSAFVSLLAVVILIAFLAGVSYAVIAIPSQTQLQEDLPAEVRGRVFGVLNMLVSVASFLPIIVVGPIADFFGTSRVILVVGTLVLLSGIASVFAHRGHRMPVRPADTAGQAPVPVEPVAVSIHVEVLSPDPTERGSAAVARNPADAARHATAESSEPGHGEAR